MSKIQVVLDAAKIRPLVSNRTFKNKDGVDVTVQEVKFELVDIKPENHKVIYEKDRFKIVKTHFAAANQTKEEREAGAATVYVGEGFSHVWDNEGQQSTSQPAPAQTGDSGGDFPF